MNASLFSFLYDSYCILYLWPRMQPPKSTAMDERSPRYGVARQWCAGCIWGQRYSISLGNLNLLVSRIQKVVPLTNVLTRLLDELIPVSVSIVVEMMNDERWEMIRRRRWWSISSRYYEDYDNTDDDDDVCSYWQCWSAAMVVCFTWSKFDEDLISIPATRHLKYRLTAIGWNSWY